MSRHNRMRRKWRCTKCKWHMHPELAAPGEALAARAGVTDRLVHVCGHCKTCHYAEGDGVRALTPAELFDLHVAFPATMARMEMTAFPESSTPAGTITIAAG